MNAKRMMALVVAAFFTLTLAGEIMAAGTQAQDRTKSTPGFPSGINCRQQSTVDPQTHQEFMDATEGLRTELLAKRSAYFELMNSTSPAKEEAQQIWSEMFDLQTQIRAKATELGITPMGGPGFGSSGPCNGTGTHCSNCQKNK